MSSCLLRIGGSVFLAAVLVLTETARQGISTFSAPFFHKLAPATATSKRDSKLNSTANLVRVVINRLSELEVLEGVGEPAVRVRAADVSLCRTLIALPTTDLVQEFQQNPYLMYSLIKILTTTRWAIPHYDSQSDEHSYGIDLRQNLLEFLNRVFPRWFQASLDYLDHTITIAGEPVDPYETEVAFLAATGWIDRAMESRLLKERRNVVFVQKVKSFLSQQPTSRSLPKTLLLADPINRVAVLNLIKARTFLSREPLTELAARLAFFSPEDLEALAQKAPTLEDLIKILPQKVARDKARERLQGLYIFCFQTYKNILEAPFIFVEEVERAIFNIGGPFIYALNSDLFKMHFHSLLSLLKSFLPWNKVRDFWEGLVFYWFRKSCRDLLQHFTDFWLTSHCLEKLYSCANPGKFSSYMYPTPIPLVDDFLNEWKPFFNPDPDQAENQSKIEENLQVLKKNLMKAKPDQNENALNEFLTKFRWFFLGRKTGGGKYQPAITQKHAKYFSKELKWYSFREEFLSSCFVLVFNAALEKIAEDLKESYGKKTKELEKEIPKIRKPFLDNVRQYFEDGGYMYDIYLHLGISEVLDKAMTSEVEDGVLWRPPDEYRRLQQSQETISGNEAARQALQLFERVMDLAGEEGEIFNIPPPTQSLLHEKLTGNLQADTVLLFSPKTDLAFDQSL